MRGNARECIRARAQLYPGLDLERISLAARALATRALCLFLLSDVFATRALCLFCLAMFLETRALCLFLCFFMFLFFCYMCFMFVFLTLTIPRSLYFSECKILTALPNYWAPSFLSASHGR